MKDQKVDKIEVSKRAVGEGADAGRDAGAPAGGVAEKEQGATSKDPPSPKDSDGAAGQGAREIGGRDGGAPGDGGRTGHGILGFKEIVPWAGAVVGEALLDELERVLKRFVVLPEQAAPALALWILHTYAYQFREVCAYIGLESPEKRCGKTMLLAVLSELVRRPVVAANISPSAFFRAIHELEPTLLIDEADTVLHRKGTLLGILNAGYCRGTGYVTRVAGKARGARDSRMAQFSCYCPKALAAIGHLPDTLEDRCIIIRMQRRRPGEQTERLWHLQGGDLRRQCARFAADHKSEIAESQPVIPSELNQRAAQIWTPLLALADAAGGKWPERARQAAVHLTASAEESNPSSALFLDAYAVFTVLQAERVFSRTLVQHLSQMRERPWATGRGPITEHWLAAWLRRYEIRPRCLRIGKEVANGYMKADFKEASERYVPASEAESLGEEGNVMAAVGRMGGTWIPVGGGKVAPLGSPEADAFIDAQVKRTMREYGLSK